MVISSGGGEGGHRQGFKILWVPPGDGDLLQIPGRVSSETEDDWSVVMSNLAWANTVWSRMLIILSREGAMHWVSDLFFRP